MKPSEFLKKLNIRLFDLDKKLDKKFIDKDEVIKKIDGMIRNRGHNDILEHLKKELRK